jgi:nucleotide-binding universal stress UspA family protein
MNNLCETAPARIEKSGLNSGRAAVSPAPARVYRRILLGTDFSAASAPAFEQGLKLAKQNGAELLIAHCFTMPGNVSFMPPAAYDEWKHRCRTDGTRSIAALRQKARANGVKAHALVLTGLPDDLILETSKRLGVDLIVIGTHGRRGVSRFLLGSVAARVVLLSPCAVLIVPSH